MNRYRRRKSERQFVWEYMRRNRMFCVDDLLPLVDMKTESLYQYLRQLEHGGYIRAIKRREKVPKRMAERCYRMTKDTGILCPVWTKSGLTDRNKRHVSLRKDLGSGYLLFVSQNGESHVLHDSEIRS